MSSSIIMAIMPIFTTIIGAGAVLFSNWISNRASFRKELLNREVERERWLREKMDEAYINCLSSLSKILLHRAAFEALKTPNMPESRLLQEILPVCEEARKWLGALLIHYPDKQKAEFEAFDKQVRKFNIYTGDNDIKALYDSVSKLASDDFRFQLQLPKGLEDIKRGKLKE